MTTPDLPDPGLDPCAYVLAVVDLMEFALACATNTGEWVVGKVPCQREILHAPTGNRLFEATYSADAALMVRLGPQFVRSLVRLMRDTAERHRKMATSLPECSWCDGSDHAEGTPVATLDWPCPDLERVVDLAQIWARTM